MQAGLLNISHDDHQWQWWSWQHKLSHDAIRAAISTKYNEMLTDYEVDPISALNMPLFLQNNQSLHDDFNGVLKLQGVDLLDVDMSDDRQRDSWIWYHFLEHQTAEQELGISS